MLTLAFDTATEVATSALVDGDEVLGERASRAQTLLEDVDALLRQALTRVSVKDAVGEVALATGRPRREVYQRALALAKDDGDAR